MDQRTVTVEIIHGGGQPAPYADHLWEAYLTFSVPEGQLWASKYGHDEETAKRYANFMIHSFREPRDVTTAEGFYAPYLAKIEQVSPGRWHVVIKEPYID